MGRHAAEHPAGTGQPQLPDEGANTVVRPGDLAARRQEGDEARRSGFLGSGLSSAPSPGDDSSKGLRRLALVSGVSVVLTLGLIVGGVQVLSGRTELTVQSLGTNCAAPGQCDTERTADSAPTDDHQTGDGSASSTPSASAGRTPPGSRSATPGSTPSVTAGTTASATPGTTPATGPGDSPTRDVTTQSPETPPSASAPVVAAPPPPPPSDDGQSEPETTQPAASDRVRVSVRLDWQAGGWYGAKVTVHNEADDLSSWTVGLPLEGSAVQVGADHWDQNGNTLSIGSDRKLRSGRDTTVSLTFRGRFQAPGGCTLAGGECTVSSTSR
ncbi:hypothetical protein GCM10023194_00990 [Planotetraspora phitsanulokensis]|uniref:CBM2 domain-containing protein n=1 Tax=Planotetraspora phitsanulokensis TaxID=575192 RepID=A0A8J3XHN5_9ACTN|nr:hypothetical protein [Planotetraspora phitsanulokensis]GII40131.1 hypothetical protein Pph01_51340 [Planotetraspora phitsanulokensis]